MKNWKLILGVFLAVLLLAVTPLTVMAAGNNNLEKKTAGKVQLAIVQPRVVEAGQAMQMTVMERLTQNPINGAEVWSVSKKNIKNIKGELQGLISGRIDNITMQDCVDILKTNGSELGVTDAAGKLTCTFNNAAEYCLVALKAGYRPAISWMTVRQDITISALKKAAPGESVTITISQKVSAEPINEATVWAVDSSKARALKNKLKQLRLIHKGDLENIDWNTQLNGLAVSLGTTGINGQVTHTFTEGKYILVGVKKGCQPALTKINITQPEPASTSTDSE